MAADDPSLGILRRRQAGGRLHGARRSRRCDAAVLRAGLVGRRKCAFGEASTKRSSAVAPVPFLTRKARALAETTGRSLSRAGAGPSRSPGGAGKRRWGDVPRILRPLRRGRGRAGGLPGDAAQRTADLS